MSEPLPMHIRPFEPTDVPALHAIFACPGVLPHLLDLPSTSLADVERRYGQQPRNPDRHDLVAEVDDRVVGHAGIVIPANPRLRHGATFYIAVHDAFHGRGVGARLMTAVLDVADRWLRLHRLHLEVNVENLRAIQLYERMGFVREGVLRGSVVREGAYGDTLVMGRLRPTP